MRTICFLFLIATIASAQVIRTTDGSSSDVQAKLNAALTGDTITLPAGSGGVFNWTTGVSRTDLPSNVTLKGAGTSATGGGDQTIIQDDVMSAGQVLNIGGAGGLRLTGITFRSGASGPSEVVKDAGTINISSGSVRIDHCHFYADAKPTNSKMLRIGTAVYGVMDHCIVELMLENSLYVYNGRFGGGGDQQGNYEWTLPTAFGSADYFFIEDNIFNGINSVLPGTRAYDGFTAARIVIRFNTLFRCSAGETHATGHSADDRGPRSQEVYGNSMTSDLASPGFCAIDIKNGTYLIWGNDWSDAMTHVYHMRITRFDNQPYTQAPTPTGWGYAGTQFNGTGSNWDGGTALGTDTVTGKPCLDQPGRGQGDLLVGNFPSKTNQTTGTIFWPHQALEPIYIWKNVGGPRTGGGGDLYANKTDDRIIAGQDYYQQASGIQTSPTSPFNGTTGVGWGTLANRPTTCTAGVAYFATDQGNWNQSSSNPYGVQQSGADGVLYKATATNTWTAYYTPYTYPHPLQGVDTTPGNGNCTTINATTLRIGP